MGLVVAELVSRVRPELVVEVLIVVELVIVELVVAERVIVELATVEQVAAEQVIKEWVVDCCQQVVFVVLVVGQLKPVVKKEQDRLDSAAELEQDPLVVVKQQSKALVKPYHRPNS